MTDKTKLSEEVDNYFTLRNQALNEVVGRITAKESDDDRVLMLDGLGFTVEQEDRCARITLGVSNIAAFTEELIARGEPWISHLSKLPEDLREQVLSAECDLTQSGALHSHDCYTITNRETGEEFPLWLSQVIYQNDDPILEAFYIGHEEGHMRYSRKLWMR